MGFRVVLRSGQSARLGATIRTAHDRWAAADDLGGCADASLRLVVYRSAITSGQQLAPADPNWPRSSICSTDARRQASSHSPPRFWTQFACPIRPMGVK